MTPQVPDSEPKEIIIGETVKWRSSDPDYSPTDGWALKYYLRGPGSGTGKGLNLTEDDAIAVDGSSWLITIPSTTLDPDADPLPPASDQLAAGDYYWERWVEQGAEKYLRDRGKVIVKQSLAVTDAATVYDGRSETKKTLDAIRAAMAGRATAAQSERTIGNTTIRFMTMADLLIAETRWQQLYNQEVRAERLRNGAPFLQNVNIRLR
jgi:hypothetical protein